MYIFLKEAEVKSIAAQMKFSEIPISCQPNKMNLWNKFVSFFGKYYHIIFFYCEINKYYRIKYSFFFLDNDDCEKYYETKMTNPKLKITPALALSHFLSTIILHPISNLGSTISIFINNATGN